MIVLLVFILINFVLQFVSVKMVDGNVNQSKKLYEFTEDLGNHARFRIIKLLIVITIFGYCLFIKAVMMKIK